jgi:hypothetical protein
MTERLKLFGTVRGEPTHVFVPCEFDDHAPEPQEGSMLVRLDWPKGRSFIIQDLKDAG